MAYLNEDGLARYDGLIKQWVALKSGTIDGIDALLNWQRTNTAGVVTCYPLPVAPLDPVVNFLFTETGPVSGTKGPDNPSTIVGIESVKVGRCGKNLVYTQPRTVVFNGVTFTIAEDGHITANGTGGTEGSTFAVSTIGLNDNHFETVIPIVAGHTYTISGCPSEGSNSSYYMTGGLFDKNGKSITYNVLNDKGNGKTYTATSDGYIRVGITIAAGYTASNLVFAPQIEESSTATSYEPPERNLYTIPLNSTYYGGSVDLSAGTMTVTHSSQSLNGDTYLSGSIFEEQADVYVVGFYPNPERLITLSDSSDAACSILPIAIGTGAKNYPCAYLANNAMGIRLSFSKASLGLGDGVEASAVRTAVKAFLAQHPGFLIYPVATPYTVPLTPTQIYSLSQTDSYNPRINTVYSDQVSVQVGYPKSPQATQNELTNAVVSLGGNV